MYLMEMITSKVGCSRHKLLPLYFRVDAYIVFVQLCMVCMHFCNIKYNVNRAYMYLLYCVELFEPYKREKSNVIIK